MTLNVLYMLNFSDLPRECIEDCSQPGSNDVAVDHWRRELGFTVNRARAVECLVAYGCWERDELAHDDDDAIAERILWLACNDFREYLRECEGAGLDPHAPPDSFSPSAGSDIFVLEG